MNSQLIIRICVRALPACVACLVPMLLHASDLVIMDQPLPNGDFSQGLAEWTVDVSPSGTVPPGSVSVVGGAALIAKGGAFRAGLSQAFEAPEGLQALRLRVTQLPQFGSSGTFIPEAFDVHVTGADGFSAAASWRPGASSAANAAAVPAGFNLGDGVTFSNGELRIPIVGVAAGASLTMAAALVGASADVVATVAIDDVVMEVEQKVEPPIPDRIDGCGIFRDRFEISHGVAGIARCAQGQLNDTGIIACVGGECPAPGLPGQDAEFGRDALSAAGQLNKLGTGPAGFDYTKLDADGEPLPATATEWACVRDNYAGLTWEVKVDDSGDPRHHEHTFSWYQPDADTNGGQAGLADGGICSEPPCDLQGLVTAVNETRLCGVTDWRVPTRQELISLVNAGSADPAISPAFFPLTEGTYWSITPMAADPASAWSVDYTAGDVNSTDKVSPLKLRLVRELK